MRLEGKIGLVTAANARDLDTLTGLGRFTRARSEKRPSWSTSKSGD